MANNNLAPDVNNSLDVPQNLDAEVQRLFGLDPSAVRSNLLPFYSKRTGWIAPEIVYQLAKAAAAPGYAWRGGNVTPEEAMNVASTIGTGGVASSTVAPAPANALGMFIGRRAKTWNLRAMQNAELLEKAGVAPEIIYERWGTWRGPDGEWRQEISDAPMAFKRDFSQYEPSKATNYLPRPAAPMADVLSHPELLQAYPELGAVQMEVRKQPSWMPQSAESGAAKTSLSGKSSLEVGAKTEPSALDISAHELQHLVQHAEDFAPGGTPNALLNMARKQLESSPSFALMTEANKNAEVENLAFKMYKSLMGEAEARAVAARRNLTPEQLKKTFPLKSYDIPLDELKKY